MDEEISIIGAAGRMGRGIALELLESHTFVNIKKDDRHPPLHLIDTNQKTLATLRPYLRTELTRKAEKKIILLRSLLASREDLVSNEEIIQHFVERALDAAWIGSCIEASRSSSIIFEAIAEDVEVKVALLRALGKEQLCLSNTSAIPIGLLEEKSGCTGRVAGFHFYNPPSLHPLIELVLLSTSIPALTKATEALAKKLGKTVVHAGDVPGFIGNGFLFREIAYAATLAHELSKQFSPEKALYLIDLVTGTWLIRPLGLFSLIDFIGREVCQQIWMLMSRSIPALNTPTMQLLFQDTCPLYRNKGREIYSLTKETYVAVNPKWKEELGPLPSSHKAWKEWRTHPGSTSTYLEELAKGESLGASLAWRFYQNSQQVAEELIETGTVASHADLKEVLTKGFFHVLKGQQ